MGKGKTVCASYCAQQFIRSIFSVRVALVALIALGISQGASADSTVHPILRLLTNESGIHRITFEQLLSAGHDLSGLRHRKFGLISEGQRIPIRTKGGMTLDGRSKDFGPGGYIEFYASEPADRYNDQKSHTLIHGGERLNLQRKLVPSKSMPRAALKELASRGASDYQKEISLEQQNFYDFLSPSSIDPWHQGRLIANGEIATSDEIQFEIPSSANSVDMEIEVFTLAASQESDAPFVFTPQVNNYVSESISLSDQSEHSIYLEDIPVHSGSNSLTVTLQPPGGEYTHVAAVNKTKLKVTTPAVALSNELKGRFSSNEIVVEGFEKGQRILAYQFVEGQPIKLRGARRVGTKLVLVADSDNAEYLFIGESALETPTVLSLPEPAVITEGQAEYLIISHPSLMGPELDRLVQLKASEYSVQVIDVNQIFSQFGDQLPNAAAIHRYIQFAAQNLGTRFVALIGTDTMDPLQFAEYSSPVPSMIPTLYRTAQGGELISRQVQSDAAYGDINDDGVPDIPVGRFPVRSQQELKRMIDKMIRYTTSSAFTLAALGSDQGFKEDAQDWITSLPEGSGIRGQMENRYWEDFRANVDDDGAFEANREWVSALNLGVLVANYLGHASKHQLGSTTPALLTNDELESLSNFDSPFVALLWSSWTAEVSAPNHDNNMLYKLLSDGNHGATALVGFSSITSRLNANRLSREFNRHLFVYGTTLGEALIAAKQTLTTTINDDLNDVILGTQIFGDPAMVVQIWQD